MGFNLAFKGLTRDVVSSHKIISHDNAKQL